MEISQEEFFPKALNPNQPDDFLSKADRIITGINTLFNQYKSLQQPVNAINNGQAGLGQIAQLFDALEKGGMGDKRLSEVINQLPFTVNQLKGFLPK